MKEVSNLFVAPVVPGFTYKKLLSASHRSSVHLATDREGRWVALKALRLPFGIDRQSWATRWADLQKLTAGRDGLLPILEFGELEGTDAWFYSMPAADDASDEAAGNPTLYNPLTLRLRLKVGGPLDNVEVLDLGGKLAAGLQGLHTAGLVHRDVKPSNIFFVGARPKLGDYDLMLTPDDETMPRGTEGFYPIEEQASPATDVYALGKTLYEAWTGLDRLEFPSLPPGLAGNKEWLTKGAALNQLLLKACNVRPRCRLADGSVFQIELERLRSSEFVGRISRKSGVIAGVLASVVLVGTWWTTHFPETTFDAVQQFSATKNPTGVWSYGFSPGRLDAFNLFTNAPYSGLFPGSTVKVSLWGRNLPSPANHPEVMKNGSEFTRENNRDLETSACTLAVSSGERPNPTYGIVRFTNPKDGLYSIYASFFGIQFSGPDGGTTTDVHVLINGASIFDSAIDGFGQKQRYESPTPVHLSPGARVDFVVGPGNNGNSSSDWTGLTALIRSCRH